MSTVLLTIFLRIIVFNLPSQELKYYNINTLQVIIKYKLNYWQNSILFFCFHGSLPSIRHSLHFLISFYLTFWTFGVLFPQILSLNQFIFCGLSNCGDLLLWNGSYYPEKKKNTVFRCQSERNKEVSSYYLELSKEKEIGGIFLASHFICYLFIQLNIYWVSVSDRHCWLGN